MKIVKFVLHRYKRVFLSDIETIEYEPKDNLQIILGSNGSGKSSLLSQLNPLPGNLTKDYRDGGYKYIEIEHAGKYYKLMSGVNGTKSHSFIMDGIEYNIGGTISVQAELVRNHFNIDVNKLNVIIGLNKFTNMSPTERKRWITEISDVDYSYSIGVYNKLKSRHRDILGGIKLTQSNIVKLESETLSDSEIDKLNLDIKYVSGLIEHILKLISNVTVKVDINKTIDEIGVLTNRLNSNNIDMDVKFIEQQITTENVRIEGFSKRIETITNNIDMLGKVSSLDIVEVDNKLDDVNNRIRYIESDIYLKEDLGVLYRYMLDNYSEIVGLVTELGEYRLDSNPTIYNGLVSKLDELKNSRNRLNNSLLVLDRDIKNQEDLYKDDNKIVCVNCNHTWHKGYDPNRLDNFKKEKENLLTKINNLDVVIKEKTLEVETIQKKLDIINRLRGVSRGCLVIWKYILNELDIHNADVTVILDRVDRVNMDVVRWIEVIKLKEELLLLNNAKKDIEISNKVINDINNSNKDQLTLELDEVTQLINNSKREVERFNVLLKVSKSLEEGKALLKDNLNTVYKEKDNYIKSVRDKYLSGVVVKLKEVIIDLNNQVKIASNNRDKLKNDVKTLNKYNEIESVVKLMVKELSPSEGLIAKSINSFLNVLLRDVNALINSVWDYEMLILPCEVSEGNDLDYKFKVLVDNKEVIEDISKTSSSMQEIIDLAFRIVFIKYSGLEEFPLVLDEFGRTFDARHRITAYNVVDKIMSSNFNQIFMVSHFEGSYGRFSNADVNILNTNGVDMNNINKYNVNMKLY